MAPEPYICEAKDPSSGRPVTVIFLHGYGDDAEGGPLGLVQQFQWNHKLPYIRWYLPNAGRHPDAMESAWYMPKSIPNSLKPRVPGHEDEDEDEDASNQDDEEGILKSCDRIDEMVRAEIERGVEPSRIVVGGFSQGCAVSVVWGLVGKERHNVGGIMLLSGYFPLAERIGAIRKERKLSENPVLDEEKVKWFYVHGDRDVLLGARFFRAGQEELAKWVNFDRDVETHLYERMAHTIAPPVLRGMLNWLTALVPP